MTRLVCLLLILGVSGAALAAPRPPALLIYNRSPSVPIGFYLRSDAEPSVGSFVTVSTSAVAPAYTALRNYSDRSDRFIKRIAAVAGDHVCARGDRVAVGRHTVLMRQVRDGQGRALPAWSECRALRAGEFFLAGDTDDSFDSRYWGPVSISDIDGVWRRVGHPAQP